MEAEWVLINGTVYRRSFRPRIRNGEVYCWRRISVPPTAEPGRRLPVKVQFDALPDEAEVIDKAMADRLIAESLERWKDRLRAQAAGKAET